MTNNKNRESNLTSSSLLIDDVERTYHTYIPDGLGVNDPLPLILFYHGSRGSGQQFSSLVGFNKLAEQKKYILVYPDTQNNIGNWAEGCDCNIADRLKVKDVAFTKGIIDQISEQYIVDKNRIYAIGFSQGGLFVNRLACEESDLFAGIVVVAANMSEPLSKTCNPESSTRIKIIQGTADQVLPYSGSQNGSLSLLSARQAVQFWAMKNQIDSDPFIFFIPDEQNKRVEVLSYQNSLNNSSSDVRLHSLIGIGHGWPQFNWYDINQEIVNFVALGN